jgi:Ca2+-binding EF-hand superfamily protein
MSECALTLSMTELRQLFQYFDKDGSGTINFDEFLNGCRDPMNQRRRDLVMLAFQKMDRDGSGIIDAGDIVGAYNAKKHPDVISGKKTEQDILGEFLDTFDVGGVHDGKVTTQEWMNYYENISASIDMDDYFELMIRNAWHISGGEGWCANTSCGSGGGAQKRHKTTHGSVPTPAPTCAPTEQAVSAPALASTQAAPMLGNAAEIATMRAATALCVLAHTAHEMQRDAEAEAVLPACSIGKEELAAAHEQSQALQQKLDVMALLHSAELQAVKKQLGVVSAQHQVANTERKQHLETIRRSMTLVGGGTAFRTFFSPIKCDTSAEVDELLAKWGVTTTSSVIVQRAAVQGQAKGIKAKSLQARGHASEAWHRHRHFSNDTGYGFEYLYCQCGELMLDMLKAFGKLAGRSSSPDYIGVTSTEPSAAGFATTIEPYLGGSAKCNCGRPKCRQQPITTVKGALEFDMIIPVSLIQRTIMMLGKHTSKIVLTQLVFMCVGAVSFRPCSAECNACSSGMGPSDAMHVASLLIMRAHWPEVSSDCFGSANALAEHEVWEVKQQ